jgi:hypothetical protein
VTVWLDVPADVRLRRALERDGPELRERWLTDWIPSEDEYEQAQQPQNRVDLIVVDEHPASRRSAEGTPR